MIRRWCIILLVLCLTAVTIEAQRVTHRFENVSMSDALRYLQSQSSQYHIVFIFNDLEDFSVTASVKNQTIPEAIRHLIGFLRWIGKRTTANTLVMGVYYNPVRAFSRMTGAAISMAQLDGLIMMFNGHFFKGLHHFFKMGRARKKAQKAKEKAEKGK